MFQFRESVFGIFNQRQRPLSYGQQNSSRKLLFGKSRLHRIKSEFLEKDFKLGSAFNYRFHSYRNDCSHSLCTAFYQYSNALCFKKKINNKINYHDCNYPYPNVQPLSVYDLLTNRDYAYRARFTVSV